MKATTDNVTVEGYDQWKIDGELVTRGDGSPVEFVKYRSEGDPRYRTLTLDATINGQRPTEGEVCRLLIADELVPQARNRRGDGEAFITYKEKRRVVEFLPAA